MNYSYYYYSKNQLIMEPKIPLRVLENPHAVFNELAMDMIECIETNNASNKSTVLICPVGPIGQYPIFVDMVNRKRISLKNCWFINMDEYLEEDLSYIDIKNKLSFRGFMKYNVYDKIDSELLMDESQRIFPNPTDPTSVDKLLETLGGSDIAFGGIGINGHLAFNEPDEKITPEDFAQLSTRILRISPETRTANAISDMSGAIELMPKNCITLGMKSIVNARKVRLGVFRDWHRAVVRRAAFGEISSSFPVSILQKHPDTKIYVADNVTEKIL